MTTDTDTQPTTPQPDSHPADNGLPSGREVLEQLNRSHRRHTGQAADEKPDEKPRHTEDDEDDLSLKEVIREQAIEGERAQARQFSLRKILGGDILNTAAIRRQIWLFILIAFFLVIYISNRYGCQQDIIEIDRLQTQLQDAKYRALSSTSQLTERSRESNVLQLLKNQKDSTLKMPNQPPYMITVPEEK